MYGLSDVVHISAVQRNVKIIHMPRKRIVLNRNYFECVCYLLLVFCPNFVREPQKL